jgi:hypothetical protein
MAHNFQAFKEVQTGFPFDRALAYEPTLFVSDAGLLKHSTLSGSHKICYFSSDGIFRCVLEIDRAASKVLRVQRLGRQVLCWSEKKMASSDYIFKSADIVDTLSRKGDSPIHGDLIDPCSDQIEGFPILFKSNSRQDTIICCDTSGKVYCFNMSQSPWALTWQNHIQKSPEGAIDDFAASATHAAVSTSTTDPKYIVLHFLDLATGATVAKSKRHRSNLSRLFCVGEDRFLLLLRNRMHLYDSCNGECLATQDLPSTAHHGKFRIIFRYNVLLVADEALLDPKNFYVTIWRILRNEIIKVADSRVNIAPIEELTPIESFTEEMEFHAIKEKFSKKSGFSSSVARFRIAAAAAPEVPKEPGAVRAVSISDEDSDEDTESKGRKRCFVS